MKNIFAIILIAISSSQIYSQSTFQEKIFSPAELTQDLDFLFTKLEEIHPNLYAYTPKKDVDDLIQKTKAELNKPMTRTEFALKVIPIVTSLKDGHTSLQLPQEERADYLKSGGRIFPFDVRISENKVFIRENYSSDHSIAVNSEFLTINGIPSETILGEMRKFLSAELEFYRDIRVERDFRRLLWYLYGFGDEFGLSISYDNSVYDRKVEGLNQKDFEAKLAEQGNVNNSKPFSYYQTDNTLGVIDFKQMSQRKRFKYFLDSVFTVVKINNINTLVIDIRKNGGGDSRLGDMLFNYITDHPYKMAEQMDVKVSKEAKRSIKKSILKWYLYPLYPVAFFHPQARLYFYGRSGKTKTFKNKNLQHPKKEKLKFTGKTYLLTGNYTFSSANMLAAAYKCFQMGTIVGEETGGVLAAYGDLIRFQLPNTQLTAYCSHKRFVHPCYDDKVHGVKPDIEIKPTLEDIRNERDAVMEYVKSIIVK